MPTPEDQPPPIAPPAIPAPPAEDFTRVHYSLAPSARGRQKFKVPASLQDAMHINPRRPFVAVLRLPRFFAMGIAVTLAGALSPLIIKLTGANVWIVYPIMIAACIAFGIWFLRGRSLPRVPKGISYDLAKEPDPRFRVCVSLTDRQAHAILQEPIKPLLFEPRLYALPLALPKPAWPASVAYGILTGLMIFVWMVFTHPGFSRLRMGTTFTLPSMGPWTVWGIMTACLIPFAWTWPTYLRITPGRLEVLRYGVLGRGSPARTSFDLRSARVYLNLGAGYITVQEAAKQGLPQAAPQDPPAEPQDTKTIRLPDWGAPWHEIARSILEAAAYQGPLNERLPEDALVG